LALSDFAGFYTKKGKKERRLEDRKRKKREKAKNVTVKGIHRESTDMWLQSAFLFSFYFYPRVYLMDKSNVKEKKKKNGHFLLSVFIFIVASWLVCLTCTFIYINVRLLLIFFFFFHFYHSLLAKSIF